jgi:hypothetical protein
MPGLKYSYSYNSEHDARMRGEILLAKMGPDWELVVHENIGWFYHLRTESLSLSEYADNNGKPTYSVLVGEGGAGKGHWTFNRKGLCYDPWEALGVAIGVARRVVDKDLDLVTKAEAVLASSMTHADRLARHFSH